ncbi:universal stress protein [Halovenus rubra]|uniref:Universal stress protein n=2 Tax=Halovenus rubra TaxID=869890 RepID=A0ABD5X8E5_9EURY|nr:universal stress protein [Halovenus rubra]
MPKHVLVPVDGSDHSWDAFDFAVEEHDETAVTALYVINPLEGDYEPSEDTAEAVKRSEKIETAVLERETGQKHPTFVTRNGRPADEIVDYANTEDIDQIVMGSRGLSGVKRVLLGSVAETVVRRAETPVNIVR